MSLYDYPWYLMMTFIQIIIKYTRFNPNNIWRKNYYYIALLTLNKEANKWYVFSEMTKYHLKHGAELTLNFKFGTQFSFDLSFEILLMFPLELGALSIVWHRPIWRKSVVSKFFAFWMNNIIWPIGYYTRWDFYRADYLFAIAVLLSIILHRFPLQVSTHDRAVTGCLFAWPVVRLMYC